MIDKKELIKQYKVNKRGIKKTYDINEKQIKQLEKERERIREYYWKLEQEVQDNKHKQLNKVREQKNEAYKEKDVKVEELNKPIDNVKRILTFLKLDNQAKIDIDHNQLMRDNKDSEIEYLGNLYSGEFLKLRVYISKNGWMKKVNKYSLYILGRCLFGSDDRYSYLPLPYGYSGDLRDNYVKANIKTRIKDLPTKELLKEYYNKRKDKILKEFIEKYKVIKKEYLETISKYKLEDFKCLFDVECEHCGFFLLDKNTYSLSFDEKKGYQCPKCDKWGLK